MSINVQALEQVFTTKLEESILSYGLDSNRLIPGSLTLENLREFKSLYLIYYRDIFFCKRAKEFRLFKMACSSGFQGSVTEYKAFIKGLAYATCTKLDECLIWQAMESVVTSPEDFKVRLQELCDTAEKGIIRDAEGSLNDALEAGLKLGEDFLRLKAKQGFFSEEDVEAFLQTKLVQTAD